MFFILVRGFSALVWVAVMGIIRAVTCLAGSFSYSFFLLNQYFFPVVGRFVDKLPTKSIFSSLSRIVLEWNSYYTKNIPE